MSHSVVRCTGSPSVCIHCGTAGDFVIKWPQGGEWGHRMQDGVEQDGSIHLSSPGVCCGSPRGKGPELGRSEMLGQPSPAFAAICLPWAAGDTVPTACSKKPHPFAVSDFSPAAAPAGPCWQERRGEVRQGGQLGSCRLLSQRSALDTAVDARSQPGRRPCRRALPALEGGDGVWIAADGCIRASKSEL